MKVKVFDGAFDYFNHCWLWYRWEDVKYWFRKKYQRWTTGFAHEESWNLYDHCSIWLVPRLKHFRANLSGWPGCVDSLKEWEEILDEMIWCFENINEEPSPNYPEGFKHGFGFKETDNDNLSEMVFNDDTSKIDWTPIIEHQERVQKGVDMFAKYYRNLWD